jgi:hypothetical protein
MALAPALHSSSGLLIFRFFFHNFRAITRWDPGGQAHPNAGMYFCFVNFKSLDLEGLSLEMVDPVIATFVLLRLCQNAHIDTSGFHQPGKEVYHQPKTKFYRTIIWIPNQFFLLVLRVNKKCSPSSCD